MKKYAKFLIAALSLSAVIFAGCKNGLSPVSGGTYTGTDDSDITYKTVTLTVTGDPEYVQFPIADEDSEDARTIVADSLTATSLKYYLHYTNIKSGITTYGTTALTFTAPDAATPNVGTVPLTLEDGNYEFTLYATQTAPSLVGTSADVTTLATNATLIGKTSADLRSTTERVHFYMSPDGLTGNSSIELKVYTDGWKISDYTKGTTAYTSSFTLSKVDTGTPVSGMSDQSITLSDTVPSTANLKTSAGIQAGTYNLTFTFTNGEKNYEWSDLIVLMPHNDIKKEVGIPDIIEKLPTAPTNLYVEFKDCANTDENYFNVAFQWTDKSNNESYFKLELAEVGSDATPFGTTPTITATTTDWGTLTDGSSYFQSGLKCNTSSIIKYGEDFYGKQDVWVSGSLLKNNTQAILKLPLGKRYVARLCACNSAGDSTYTYMDFSGAVSGLTGYSQFAADAKTINRYRLNYYLNGGTITYADASTSTATITEYRTQNDKANSAQGTYTSGAVTAGTYVASKITSSIDVPSCDIMNPTCDTTTITSLIKGNNPWTYWKKDKINGICYNYTTAPATIPDQYEPNNYTGYENLNLFGCYNAGKADVTVYDPNLHNITASNLTVTGNGVTSTIATANAVQLNLNATGAGSVSWTVNYTSDQTAQSIKWDKVNLKIKRQGTSYYLYDEDLTKGTSDFTATTDLSVYSTGKYAVIFSAYNSSSQLSNIIRPYQYTVYLSIVEGTVTSTTQHSITWSNPTNGTLTATAGGAVTSPATINDGTAVTFTVAPDTGYGVVSWTGATVTANDASMTTATLTVSADTTVSVTLAATHTITFPSNVTATVNGGTITSGTAVAEGVTISLTATGGTTYTWTGTADDTSTAATNTVVVGTSNVTITCTGV